MPNMDPVCGSYSYGNDDYYGDDDCYDHDYVNDDVYSINSCYKYDKNLVFYPIYIHLLQVINTSLHHWILILMMII